MDRPLILTYDVGTQSARAILVDKQGSIVDKVQMKYTEPYIRPQPGWAEQKTDFYFAHMCAASRVLMERNKDKVGDIIAVAVTVIRDTLVFLDENNRPTRDIIHWLDARKCEFDDPFPWWKTIAFKLIGMDKGTKIAYRTSKVNWVRLNQPDVWEKTKKIVCLPAYLNFRMTGRLADSPANTIAHIPMDYKKKTWMTENDLTRCMYDVPQEKLYELVPSGDVIGYITKEAAELSGAPEGLPLIATGADKACETLGLSVASPEKASISFGTSSTIEMYSENYFEPQQFLPSYPSVINKAWNAQLVHKRVCRQGQGRGSGNGHIPRGAFKPPCRRSPRRLQRPDAPAVLDARCFKARLLRCYHRLFRLPHEVSHLPCHHRGHLP